MTDSTTTLIVAPTLAPDAISATDAALQQRDELLARARRGKAITSPASYARAAELLRELTAFTRTIEDTRVAVKAPILDVGKRIDATAKALTLDVQAEASRISGLVGTYQAEVRRQEEEARRRAWEEQERIRLEAEAKERAAREAEERARREAEEKARAEQAAIAAAAERARSEAGRAKREAELKAAQERAEQERAAREQADREAAAKREEEQRAAAAKAAQAVVVSVAPKISGMAVGSDLKFEVTNLVELYEAAPYLVTLSPNVAAIKNALKNMPAGQSLPGVKHWREAKAVVR
jgi:hypothetical protein